MAADQCFSVVHAEGIYFGSVGLPKTSTAEVQGRIFMEGTVPISEFESTLQHTDSVVVGFLAPAMAIRDGYETRVTDLRKNQVANVWAPNAIKYLSIRSYRCGRHVVAAKP